MALNRFNTINRQILCGELDADAEGRSLPTGGAVVNLRVVTYTEIRDQGTQELRDLPEYHRVAVFGKTAESLRGLKKGTVVYVEGRTKTRKYTPQGETQARYYTEIQVSGIEGRCFVPGATDAVPQTLPGESPAARARELAANARPGASAPPASREPASAWDDVEPPY